MRYLISFFYILTHSSSRCSMGCSIRGKGQVGRLDRQEGYFNYWCSLILRCSSLQEPARRTLEPLTSSSQMNSRPSTSELLCDIGICVGLQQALLLYVLVMKENEENPLAVWFVCCFFFDVHQFLHRNQNIVFNQ